MRLPVLSGKLDDLLALPLILSFIQEFQRRSRPGWVMPGFQVLLSTIILFVVFEIFLPRSSARFTGDWSDGVAYGIGAWVFFRFMRGG
ncbi:MAG: hypothetical protein ACE5D1_03775 [Fidelibacterota bacterium]